jgi:hypothetical protein
VESLGFIDACCANVAAARKTLSEENTITLRAVTILFRMILIYDVSALSMVCM